MTIAIHPEPTELTEKHRLPLEHCCFCNRRTGMWSVAKDVAVCDECAETHNEEDVPSKEEWFERTTVKGFLR